MVGATDEAEQTVTISSSCDLDVSVYLFIFCIIYLFDSLCLQDAIADQQLCQLL